MERGSAALLMAAACGFLVPGAGSAQLVGDRVRVTLAGGPPTFEGEVTRITPDELELSLPGGDSRVVAKGALLGIERREGRRQWKRGFVVGATVGAFTAVALPVAYTRTRPPSFVQRITARLVLAAFVAPVTAAIGTAVGGLIKLDHWEPIPGWPRGGTTPNLHVDMRTTPDGNPALGLGVKLRF